MRIAIYARTAMESQVDIDQQIQSCLESVKKNGWVVSSMHVVSDNGVSSSTLKEQHALHSLIQATNTRPRPFDAVLVSDFTRLGRSLANILTIVELFRSQGVAVCSATQDLDSRDSHFRQMLLFQFLAREDMDELSKLSPAPAIILRIYELFLAGYSVEEVATILNSGRNPAHTEGRSLE